MANCVFIPIEADPFVLDVDDDQEDVRDVESTTGFVRVFRRTKFRHTDGTISVVYLESLGGGSRVGLLDRDL